jgi:hypothetical protein
MAEAQSDTVFGPETLKAWAEMSAENREQSRAAFRFVAPDMPEQSVALFVLDEDLPAKAVASIVEDPANSDYQSVVVSRRTYSYAALRMGVQAIVSSEGKALLRKLGRLDVTAVGTVVGPDGSSLFELEMPDQSLFKETESLTHMITVATSSESLDLPNVGRGKLYRNGNPSGRK